MLRVVEPDESLVDDYCTAASAGDRRTAHQVGSELHAAILDGRLRIVDQRAAGRPEHVAWPWTQTRNIAALVEGGRAAAAANVVDGPAAAAAFGDVLVWFEAPGVWRPDIVDRHQLEPDLAAWFLAPGSVTEGLELAARSDAGAAMDALCRHGAHDVLGVAMVLIALGADGRSAAHGIHMSVWRRLDTLAVVDEAGSVDRAVRDGIVAGDGAQRVLDELWETFDGAVCDLVDAAESIAAGAAMT